MNIFPLLILDFLTRMYIFNIHSAIIISKMLQLSLFSTSALPDFQDCKSKQTEEKPRKLLIYFYILNCKLIKVLKSKRDNVNIFSIKSSCRQAFLL